MVREPKSVEELEQALELGQQRLSEASARSKALEAELAATQRILQAGVGGCRWAVGLGGSSHGRGGVAGGGALLPAGEGGLGLPAELLAGGRARGAAGALLKGRRAGG